MNGLGRGNNEDNKEKNAIVTRETVGMTMLLFSAVAFLICVTRSLMFGDVGIAITAFLLGTFGYLAYPLLLLLVCVSLQMVSGKNFLPRKILGWGSAILLTAFLIVHLATSARFLGVSYGEYLASCFLSGDGGIATCTAGGILYALIVYPLQAILSVAGAYVVFSFLVATVLFFLVRSTPLWGKLTGGVARKSVAPKAETEARPYPGTFEELNAPRRVSPPLYEEDRRTAYPDFAQPYAQSYGERSAPAYGAQPTQEGNAPLSERDILFSGTPASSYRDNLIFDRDSRFNTQPRSSNVQNVSPVQPVTPTPPPVAESYQESYSRTSEQTRPAMPRRVETQDRVDFAEINYPQTPSYRAAPQEERVQDFYRKDVAPVEQNDFYRKDVTPTFDDYEEEFSSAPHIDDVPTRTEEPFIGFGRENPRVAPTSTEAQEQARGAEFRSLFSSDNERLNGLRFPERNAPTAEEPSVRDLPSREENFDRGITPREESFDRGISPREESFERSEGLYASRLEEEELSPESRAVEGLNTIPTRESASDLFEEDDAPFEEVQEPSVPPVLQRGGESATALPPAPPVPQPRRERKPYLRPSHELFHTYDDSVSVTQEEIDRNSQIIIETLAGFRVEAEMVRVTCGSAVTRYDIDIPPNVPVSTVIKRDEEIAMRLHAGDGVNIYSNSEVGAVSIEVPNSKRGIVGLKSLLQADAYVNAKPEALSFIIGKDVEGRPVCGNICKMKHVLVAGATGSGKSVCLTALLVSLICKYSPDEMRLILIDPKKVEFAIYEGLPHLMINEIIADAQKAVTALTWAIKEMERRYDLFQKKTKSGTLVNNLDSYNKSLSEDEEKLAKIVIVVDELADLMSVAKKDIEERIQRLTQKARAAGIHLVVATQRPSVDVITGVIKGNLPTRIAFRVIQEVDSRTILDESGAEKLLGNGDMLYRTEGMFSCLRVQGAFLSEQEVQSVIEDIKRNNESYFDDTVADFINNVGASPSGGSSDDDGAVAPQYIQALAMVVKLGTASISLIQRKCSIGYNHAGKIIEWMDAMGYISPFDGKAKARTVLLSQEEFESKYGSLD